ncbi:hypothetical protein WS62_09155 [Burkholderia sp. ABCPW 14]|nr:hypothetical protein WS62_09155 [Burkholderia sp. ABCPW 14]
MNCRQAINYLASKSFTHIAIWMPNRSMLQVRMQKVLFSLALVMATHQKKRWPHLKELFIKEFWLFAPRASDLDSSIGMSKLTMTKADLL